MPNIENQTTKSKYIDRETYQWTRQQQAKDNKEVFINATVLIAAFAVYATWTWMIIQKLRA